MELQEGGRIESPIDPGVLQPYYRCSQGVSGRVRPSTAWSINRLGWVSDTVELWAVDALLSSRTTAKSTGRSWLHEPWEVGLSCPRARHCRWAAKQGAAQAWLSPVPLMGLVRASYHADWVPLGRYCHHIVVGLQANLGPAGKSRPPSKSRPTEHSSSPMGASRQLRILGASQQRAWATGALGWSRRWMCDELCPDRWWGRCLICRSTVTGRLLRCN